MKTISQLSQTTIRDHLNGSGLGLCSGPFNILITSSLPAIASGIQTLYANFPYTDSSDFFDFHVNIDTPKTIRRWYRPKVYFSVDGKRPFKPLPKNHALAVLEWGLNWCIANQAHQYLMIHSAVVEKNGIACILPGPPGSGKSTLCAALVANGWRLFSDEMALIEIESGLLVPNPRPISLKNQSIEIIKNYWDGATIGPKSYGTDKGTVAHVAPPVASVLRQFDKCLPAHVVFPKYMAESPVTVKPLSKSQTLIQLVESCFNHNGLGKTGFIGLSDVVDRCGCHTLTYSRLDEGIHAMEQLKAPPHV